MILAWFQKLFQREPIQIKETLAPSGYKLSDEIYTVTIDSSKVEFVVVIENAIKSSGGGGGGGTNAINLNLKKTDTNGSGLEGAVFKLYSGSPSGSHDYLYSVQSGNDGTVTISNLPLGYYYLEEVKAPDGYLLDDSVHTFNVDDDSPSDMTITNEKERVLRIWKVDSSDTKKTLGGAQFKI